MPKLSFSVFISDKTNLSVFLYLVQCSERTTLQGMGGNQRKRNYTGMHRLAKLTKTQKPIVFFDGVCVLCNNGVKLLATKLDHPGEQERSKIAYCRVQSSLGKEMLSTLSITQQQCLDRFVVFDPSNDTVYSASSAALRLSLYLPFPFPLLYAGILVPKFMRDAVYDFAANRRYAWFGTYDSCLLYNEDLMDRFIDKEEVDIKGRLKTE